MRYVASLLLLIVNFFVCLFLLVIVFVGGSVLLFVCYLSFLIHFTAIPFINIPTHYSHPSIVCCSHSNIIS